MGGDRVRTPAETSESRPESKELNRQNIERYIEGCEEIAVRLDTIIRNVAESGKRPVILIPSRGAVPIFILARRFLNEIQAEGSYLADRNAKYYPEGIFNFLEGKEEQRPDDQTTVDVVLFPFTADVSLGSADDETLARELRNSCARSVLQIVKGRDFGLHDLEWYELLMEKLNKVPDDPEQLNPKNIVASLESFPVREDTQIILIDTVISGRAANDITNAFKTLGHTVIPLLAVDNSKEVRFNPQRKSEIQGTLEPIWELLPENHIFVEFPLITEDRGSALLGVLALNFINFNEGGIFHKVNRRFDSDFRPQSCVWALPPKSARNDYLVNFRQFIEAAWSCRNGSRNPCTNQDIEKLKAQTKPLTARHDAPTHGQINEVVPIDDESALKESASHIVSVRLPQKTANQWIAEFSTKPPHS